MKGKKIKLFYGLNNAGNYVVRLGSQYGQYIGQVTKREGQWRAYLGPGITATGATKDEAVLKALEKKAMMGKRVG